MYDWTRKRNWLMRGSRKFCQRVSNVFLVDEARKVPNNTISWPPSARQQNAIEMAFRWRADDGPTLNAGLVVRDF